MLKNGFWWILFAFSTLLLLACGEDKAAQDADTVTPDGDIVATCEHDGITYPIGATITIDCNGCMCEADGSFSCDLLLCDDGEVLSDGEEVNDDDTVDANIPFESYFGEGMDEAKKEKMAKFVTVDELFSYQPTFDQVSKENLTDYYIFYTSPEGYIGYYGCYEAWVETLKYQPDNNILDIVIGTNPRTYCACDMAFSVPYLVVLFPKSVFPSTPSVTFEKKEHLHTDCDDR